MRGRLPLILVSYVVVSLGGVAWAGDEDGDGIPDEADNCWESVNPDQTDQDGDDVGDPCDIDRDGDGLTNEIEATVFGTDPARVDSDGDSVTDLYDCDPLDASRSMPDDCDSVIVVRNPMPPPAQNPDPDVIDDPEPGTPEGGGEALPGASVKGGGGSWGCRIASNRPVERFHAIDAVSPVLFFFGGLLFLAFRPGKS